ncbi:hypothetical protein KL905_004948 [Ogataea polymorpha]|nr:hypothetical protein KL937_004962 [Ogataea polymorpha]KAG7888644.1 hypothetical protein KL908_005004 [Ogataea polymorpha]KAG7897553.1 hypothetical protein KL935_004983 [Ogataea polymorpha]KAG7915312.1 hypothetical protein KL905_004948 [Ogataea polymorpha]KAG7930030.1 hypothetical protein KL934_005142 [Ogataea polymorpha]
MQEPYVEPDWTYGPVLVPEQLPDLLVNDCIPQAAPEPKNLLSELEQMKRHLSELERKLSSSTSLETPTESEAEDDLISFKNTHFDFDVDCRLMFDKDIFSPRMLLMKDPLTRVSKKYIGDMKKTEKARTEFLNLKNPWFANEKDSKVSEVFKQKVLHQLPWTLHKETEVPTEDSVIDTDGPKSGLGGYLQSVMPTKKSAWLLLDRFFEYWYPHYPFVDEEQFTHSISEVIGQRSMEDEQINIIGIFRTKLVLLSSLLYLIHLGELTLYTINMEPIADTKTDENLKYLVEHPLNSRLLTAASYCSKWSGMAHMPALATLQNLLYSRIAFKHSPMEGEHSDLESFAGLVVRMSDILGLNRDPTTVTNSLTPKQVNLWRKLWLGVWTVDSGWSFQNESFAPRIHRYNTRTPVFLGETNANCKNESVERGSIAVLQSRAKLNRLFAALMETVTDLSGSVKASCLLERIKDLETYQENLTGDIVMFLDPNTLGSEDKVIQIQRINGFIQYLEIKHMLVFLYYHLFLQYELKNDVSKSKHFLMKSIRSFMSIVIFVRSSIFRLGDYFGRGNEHVVAQTVIQSIGKTRCLYFMLLARVKHVTYTKFIQGNTETELVAVCNDILKKIENLVGEGLQLKGKLAATHFSAWFASKIHSFVYSKVYPAMVDSLFNTAKEPTEEHEKLNVNIMLRWKKNDFEEMAELLSKKYECEDSYLGCSLSNHALDAAGVVDSGWIGRLITNRLHPYIEGNPLISEFRQALRPDQTTSTTDTTPATGLEFLGTDLNIDELFTNVDSSIWNTFPL